MLKLKHLNYSIQQGFTLLEVMVALAIFAVAALALTQTGRSYTNGVMGNTQRSLAYMVAMNEATVLRMNQTWLSGETEKQVEEQGQKWLVRDIPEALNNDNKQSNMQRVSIQVFLNNVQADRASTQKASPVQTLTIFLERP